MTRRRWLGIVGGQLARRLVTDSLLRNSLCILSATGANSLLGCVFWIVAARTRSPHDIGLGAGLVAAVALTAILSGVGITGALMQRLPSRPAGSPWSLTLNAGLAAGTMSGVVGAVVAGILLQLLSNRFAVLVEDGRYAALFVAGVPMWILTTLLDYAFVAERAAGYMFLRNVVTAVLKNAFLLALLPLGQAGPLGVFGPSILAIGGGVGAGLVLLRRLDRDYQAVVRGLVGQARTLIAPALGHHVITVGALAPTYLLPTLVTARLSPSDNAFFYTTWTVASVLFMIAPAVATALFAEGSHRIRDLGRTARASARIIAALLAPAMLLLLIGGRSILAWFGEGYAREGWSLLGILAASSVPDALVNIYVAMLRVRSRLLAAAAFTTGTAILTAALAWLLLPPLGIAGAGWAWLLGRLVGSVVAGVHIAWARGWPHEPRELPRSATGGSLAPGAERRPTTKTRPAG